MTLDRVAPALRGALSGASVVATGILAHNSGDGHLPGADALIMMALLAVAIGCAGGGLLSRAQWATVSLLLVAGQLATHFLLALTGGAGHAGHPTADLHAGHHAGAVPVLSTEPAEVHGLMPDTAMLMCHLVATVLSAALIVGLEAAVTALFTRVVGVLVANFRVPASRPAWAVRPAPYRDPAQRLLVLGTTGTRGPPFR